MTEDVTLLEGLLPGAVLWAESAVPDVAAPDWSAGRIDTIEADLFPEEREHIARAVDKRRAEFAAVRHCARRALRQLGFPPVPILPGEQREPLWPAGVVGSMTHCAGYCAAAVARTGEVDALGIDAEVHAPLPEGVLDIVALEAERGHLEELAGQVPEVHWDRVLFSAKESVYKAWFPLTHRWLGFEQARIVLEPGGGFQVTVLLGEEHPAGSPAGFAGRWVVRGGLIATAIGEVLG